MLVLSRRPGETVLIGSDIRIRILDILGTQVRIGIEAPRHVTIDRSEIQERKRHEAKRQP
jgi:carbon storage regulator